MSNGNWIGINHLIKSRNPEFFGLSEKITQGESQRIDKILPVLAYFQLKRRASAVELERNTRVSRDSIDKTLKVLIGKTIIKLDTVKARNEKIYKVISMVLLKQYSNRLVLCRNAKKFIRDDFPKFKKSVKNYGNLQERQKNIRKRIILARKRATLSSRNLSDEQLSRKLILDEKQQQKLTSKPHTKRASIREMKTKAALGIIGKFQNDRVCKICLDKDYRLSELTPDSETGELICKYGHVTEMESSPTIQNVVKNAAELPLPIPKRLTRQKFSNKEITFQKKGLRNRRRTKAIRR